VLGPVSFSASAKRAADSDQPIGLRVSCLHECLEQFNLFGFQTTRALLRARFDVSQTGWTGEQLLAALEALGSARKSWLLFLRRHQEAQRVARRADPSTPPLHESALKVDWLDDYLSGSNADDWLVSGVGDCSACGHGLIHHGGHACAVCSVIVQREYRDFEERREAWGRRCRVPLPLPNGG
jgi:hypothetical protein